MLILYIDSKNNNFYSFSCKILSNNNAACQKCYIDTAKSTAMLLDLLPLLSLLSSELYVICKQEQKTKKFSCDKKPINNTIIV